MDITISKLIVLTCCVVSVLTLPVMNLKDDGFFEEQFNKSFECLRLQMIQGNPNLGLPSFAPWRIHDTLQVQFNNKYFSPDITVNNLVIDGLASFKIQSLSLSHSLMFESEVYFEKLYLNASYSGTANLLSLISVYGDGNMNMRFSDVALKISTQYNMNPPLIGGLTWALSLKDANITITGLLSDEEMSALYSSVASKVATFLINQHKQPISEFFSPYIKEFLNVYIGQFYFMDFLEKIASFDYCTF